MPRKTSARRSSLARRALGGLGDALARLLPLAAALLGVYAVFQLGYGLGMAGEVHRAARLGGKP